MENIIDAAPKGGALGCMLAVAEEDNLRYLIAAHFENV
jgi:hypothetical protein